MNIHALKISLRSFLKHRSHAMLNIAGLAIGMAACLLTLLYIKDEMSYDTHHVNAERVFRIIDGNNARTPGAVAVSLNHYFPEVAATVRMRATRAIWLMQHGDRAFYEDEVYWTEPSLFDVFTIPLLKGNPETALEGNNKAVISESMARKYFGDKDPMGQVLRADKIFSFTVTGVMADFPTHSHFKAGIFLSFAYGELEFMNSWFVTDYYTYIRLNDQHHAPAFTANFQAYMDNEVKPANQQVIQDYDFSLQPLTSIHLRSRLLNELEVNSSMAYLYTLVTGVVFLLLIAIINFINFSLVHSAARTKEAGLMKVFGAGRFDIIRQHLVAALLVTGLVVVLAVLLAIVALPVFNSITGKELTLGLSQNVEVWLGLIGIAAVVGAVSGGFPGLVLSGYSPMHSLQNRLSTTFDYSSVKRVLITLQFTLSIMLIISSGVVYGQLSFMMNAPQGYDKSDVVVAPLILAFSRYGQRPSEGFQEDLLRSPNVVSVSIADYVPGLDPGRGTIGEAMVRRGDGDNIQSTRSSRILSVEHDLLVTLRMNLVRGSFLRDIALPAVYDPNHVFDVVLNEEAVRHLGWTTNEAAIDQIVEVVYPRRVRRFRVLGVVRDTHFRSLYQPVEPMLFFNSNGIGEHMTIRVQPENTAGALADLERTWHTHYPDIPLVYSFLEDDIDRLYAPERRLGVLLGICALLATVLTFLGQFNLVSLTIQQRTKEIGIHKIAGASVTQLVRLVSREFVVMAGVASLIAWPIAYLVMASWLQDFAYRTSPSPLLFVLVGAAVLAVAMATVCGHVLRLVPSNPVEALRYE